GGLFEDRKAVFVAIAPKALSIARILAVVARRGALAERPCRAMAGNGVEAVLLDLFIAHAREEIPSPVTFPNMFAAQPLPFVHIVAVFRHAKLGRIVTALHRTALCLGRALGSRWANADIVTKLRTIRCRTHDSHYG